MYLQPVQVHKERITETYIFYYSISYLNVENDASGYSFIHLISLPT